MTINGLMGGKNVKITWTGSQNFTALGTLANNDIVLRVVDPAVTQAYNVHFAYIRKGHPSDVLGARGHPPARTPEVTVDRRARKASRPLAET